VDEVEAELEVVEIAVSFRSLVKSGSMASLATTLASNPTTPKKSLQPVRPQPSLTRSFPG